MIKSGLVSVSFRKLSPENIVAAAVAAGLDGIEWGGDIHVPHGDLTKAARIMEMCRNQKITISAYGSYYRAGCPAGGDNPEFAKVLDTARVLETSTVRVWAGTHGSAGLDPIQRRLVVDDLKRICDYAWPRGISVSLEYHSNTLTDTNESAQKLLQEVNHPGLRFYWQPLLDTTREYRLGGLKQILPRLTNLHIFWWVSDHSNHNRLPLESGVAFWRDAFMLAKSTGVDHFASLEFFRGDELSQFYADAAILRSLLKEVN